MRLKKLLGANFGGLVKGSRDIEITGLSNHSKSVAPGYLFVARPGSKLHGASFISEAVRNGAVAVLTDLLDPSLKVTQIVTKDVAQAEAQLAATFYGFPSEALTTFATTGTNGKSTVSYLIQQLWSLHKKEKCGLIGTIGYDVGRENIAASLTTPDAISLQKLMHEMRLASCKACALEVSSHALDQSRVSMVSIDVAVFTNLSQDHLDYHGTMQHYAAAKAKLFCDGASFGRKEGRKPFKVVLNLDDPYFDTMRAGASDCFTYGFTDGADLHIRHATYHAEGSEAALIYRGSPYPLKTSLIGLHNLYNLAAALAAMLQTGAPIEQLLPLVAQLQPPPGRLQLISYPSRPKVYVDYAHTPDALERMLAVLHEIYPSRLHVIFGAGGDRDRSKRALMGMVASKYASRITITADNSRRESPEAIAREIAVGIAAAVPYQITIDRRQAIQQAIHTAAAEDVIVIAGRGHEQWQSVGDTRLPFCDVTEAHAALSHDAIV